jgi:hypothetical protein
MKRLSASVVVSLLAGCSTPPQGGPPAAPAHTETWSQLSNRLKNANQISDFAARNDTLRNLAIDAANQGVADVTVSATESIDRMELRDQTAEQCARLLDERGQRAGAERLADLISDPAARDRVVNFLASQTPPSAQ